MKQLLLLGLVLGSASCASEDEPPAPYHISREHDAMSADIPSQSGPVQYMAWCALEEKALGGWTDGRGSADSNLSEHLGKFGDHPCYILWRQKP